MVTCPRSSLEEAEASLPTTDIASSLPSSSVPSTGAVPPPPPPLPPSLIVPPPPPPLPPLLQRLPGVPCSPPPHVLPFGLKPKKEFKPEVVMKRLNWSKVKQDWKLCYVKFHIEIALNEFSGAGFGNCLLVTKMKPAVPSRKVCWQEAPATEGEGQPTRFPFCCVAGGM